MVPGKGPDLIQVASEEVVRPLHENEFGPLAGSPVHSAQINKFILGAGKKGQRRRPIFILGPGIEGRRPAHGEEA